MDIGYVNPGLMLLLSSGLLVGCAIWAYVICKGRGVEPGLWVLASFCLGLIGVAMTYAWAKPAPGSQPPPPPSPATGPTWPAAEYCPRCGTQRLSTFRYCRGCQFDFGA